MYYQNVRGLKTKLSDFFIASSSSSYDVIMLTETFLDDTVNSLQLFNTEFCVYRCDRNSSNSRKQGGGGTLVAVRKKFASNQMLVNEFSVLEQVWVRIRMGKQNLYLCSFYLPPYLKNDSSIVNAHIASVEAIVSRMNANDLILICGDYNYSNLCWNRSPCGKAYIDTNASQFSTTSALLADSIASVNLSQINTLRNCNDSTLDLAFTEAANVVPGMIKAATLEMSVIDIQHPPFEIELPVAVSDEDRANDSFRERINYRKIDFEQLSAFLSSQDWQCVFDSNDLNDSVEIFNLNHSDVVAG